MSNVQFPHIVFTTELNTLAEYLLHLLVVPAVPVYLSLSHQYWNIAGGEVMCQLSNPLSLTILKSDHSPPLPVSLLLY